MEEKILFLLKGKSVADVDEILNSVRKRVAMRSVYGSAKDIEAWEQQRLKRHRSSLTHIRQPCWSLGGKDLIV